MEESNKDRKNTAEVFARLAVLVAKLAIATIALYYVFSNIDAHELPALLLSADPYYLILAVLCLVVAVKFGALRLRVYLKSEELDINKRYSVAVYWAGMFFSLLLPGGISGDGYIALHLSRKFRFRALKAVRVLLITRANGLLFLNIFLFAVVLMSSFIPQLPRGERLVYGLFLLQFPVYYYFNRYLLREKLSGFIGGSPLSFASQAFFLLAAFLVFKSMGVNVFMADYLVLFLAASVASILPLTPGGIGIRELVFFKGAALVGINPELAVASSLVYFFLYVTVSVIGLVFYLRLNKIGHE